MSEILLTLNEASRASDENMQVSLLVTALSQCYHLQQQEVQTLSGMMYGKSQLFQTILRQREQMKPVTYRLLFFLLQSAITCSDFVTVNLQLTN